MLTKEDLESLKRMEEHSKREDERLIAFWQNDYPKLSKKEKTKVWASDLFRSMRTQEESGANPYIIYSQRWLKETLEREPEFMQLLPEIYRVWGGMFDSNKVDSKIKKLYTSLKK